MPHVIVKLWPGKTEEQKKDLSDRIAKALTESLGVEDKSISVALEEITKENWTKEVYIPDIMQKEHLLYKKPGYKPSDIS